MQSNIVKLIREEIMLINKHSTAASLWEREMKGEAVIKILIPAFVFHSIIVASQSFHRHTNVEQKRSYTINLCISNIVHTNNYLTIKNSKPLQGLG